MSGAVLAVHGFRSSDGSDSSANGSTAGGTESSARPPSQPAPASATALTTSKHPTRATTTKSLSPRQKRDLAFKTLEDLVDRDANRNPIRGQWVAQLDSKTEGMVDKTLQQKPFTLPDVVARIDSMRENAEYGSLVRVVHEGDWGMSTPGAKPMWVTFVDLDATSRDEVVDWCESHFTERGKSLLNVCYPREMHIP